METVLTADATQMAASLTGLGDFDALVRLHRSRIFRYVMVSLRDRDAAETLTQDCFIRAYQARDKFRGDASPGTWLMTIAVNLVRDHVRNARLRFWRRTQQASVDSAEAGDWLADTRQTSPEAAAVAKQKVAAVWQVAEHLSERQRTVFLLRFVEDMELLEIAAATGMKEGTVKVHLHRALAAVRERIKETS